MPSTQEVRLPAVMNERLLEIPDYQRPYAWRRKQLNDLWEDLDLLGRSGSHYAGTLVLREITARGEPKPPWPTTDRSCGITRSSMASSA